MSDEARKNLLKGTEGLSATFDESWEPVALEPSGDVTFGVPYALSFECESDASMRVQARFNYVTADNVYESLSDTPSFEVAPGLNHVTIRIASFERPSDLARTFFMIQAGEVPASGATLVVTRPMLVEGDTPAAWAPAEGEEIAGGGCSRER